jgi:hypothetical protein
MLFCELFNHMCYVRMNVMSQFVVWCRGVDEGPRSIVLVSVKFNMFVLKRNIVLYGETSC